MSKITRETLRQMIAEEIARANKPEPKAVQVTSNQLRSIIMQEVRRIDEQAALAGDEMAAAAKLMGGIEGDVKLDVMKKNFAKVFDMLGGGETKGGRMVKKAMMNARDNKKLIRVMGGHLINSKVLTKAQLAKLLGADVDHSFLRDLSA